MVAALSLNTAPAPEPLEPRSVEVVIERKPERHRAAILDSWRKSYQSIMPQYAKSYGLSRWDWVRFCAERIWQRGGVVLAAYVDGYPDAMLGWICGEPGMLHYAYTFGDARRKGVASNLLGAILPEIGPVRRITHRPGSGRGNLRAKAHALGWRYEPLTREELENE